MLLIEIGLSKCYIWNYVKQGFFFENPCLINISLLSLRFKKVKLYKTRENERVCIKEKEKSGKRTSLLSSEI